MFYFLSKTIQNYLKKVQRLRKKNLKIVATTRFLTRISDSLLFSSPLSWTSSLNSYFSRTVSQLLTGPTKSNMTLWQVWSHGKEKSLFLWQKNQISRQAPIPINPQCVKMSSLVVLRVRILFLDDLGCYWTVTVNAPCRAATSRQTADLSMLMVLQSSSKHWGIVQENISAMSVCK